MELCRPKDPSLRLNSDGPQHQWVLELNIAVVIVACESGLQGTRKVIYYHPTRE